MNEFRIREVRSEAGLTLAQVAEAADVSIALISQVERGLVDPSLATLRRIALALDAPLFSLFSEGEAPANTPTITRAGKETTVTNPSGDLIYRRKTARDGEIEVLHGTLQPGGASADSPWSHNSEECVLAWSGTMTIEVDGIDYTLEPGDSCHFDSRLPHVMHNRSDDTVEFIVSITPPSS